MWGSKNFLDEPVFVSRLGLESFTKLNLGLERSIEHKSSMVDTKLVNEPDLENICLEQWRGYLLCLINGHIYLADNRQKYLNKGTQQQEYEWFYWDNIGDVVNNEFKEATLLKSYDDNLFFGTENGVVAKFTDRIYNDNGRTIYCQWETPCDSFESENHVKTTNKKGCVIDIEGDITISTKINNGVFEKINDYKNTKGFIVARIKKKKWKSIQLKFSSKTRFFLYSGTLESYIGSYVKR